MNRLKEIITVLLIQLVLTIPFYTTSVYGVINKVTVKGSVGIEGFAKETDFLNFNVLAVISNDTITNNQVMLGSNIQFDKCSGSISNSFECTLRFPGNGTETFEAKSIPFTVNLFKDDKTLDDSKSGMIIIDSKAPQVKLSASQSSFSSQQNVVINYEVTDFACDDVSCSGKCAGIKSINFFDLNGTFNQRVDANSSGTGCTLSSQISIDSKTFNNGQNSVFAKAVDKFEHVSAETSVTFNVDTIAPSIVLNSFEIVRKGISLNTFSLIEVTVDVIVNISASDLNKNSVTADLSALNPAKNLKNIKAVCTSAQEGTNLCKWSIGFSPKTAGTKTIFINASDTSGNKASATINKELTLDDKGPVVQSLGTSAGARAKPSGNTITADFDEAVGLSADEAFLHIGDSKIAAVSCRKDSNWICTWQNINFGSSTKISIEADTTDVLGNAVSSAKSVEITIDNKAPVLKNISITPVGGLVQAFPGFFKVGDKIAVVANLAEESEIFATADFSKFISKGSTITGSCERASDSGNEYLCTWLTESINIANSDVITFNFSDAVGNTLIVTKSLKTFGLVNATTPDFWTNKVACSPKTIDRQLGPLINQRSFCEVSLKPNSNKSVFTVFIGAASCTGDISIVESFETFNTETGSTTPVIKITLKKNELKINNASLSCSFDIFSKVNDKVTSVPEVETAKIQLLFFNLPLGELSDKVEDKIESAVDDAEGIWELIGGLNKVVNIAKRICQLINTIYNIVALYYSIAVAIGFLDVATEDNPFTIPFNLGTIKPMAIAQCKAETSTRVYEAQPATNRLNEFCDIINCRQAYLWGPKFQNFFNNYPLLLGPQFGSYLGQPTKLTVDSTSKINKWKVEPIGASSNIRFDFVRKRYLDGIRPLSNYMNPRENLIVATAFVCLPGIIFGLDKYRQIKCLYADCLQNAVGREGLPITACEDQKSYATCKYVTGEIFALIPFTAWLDHFLGLVKGALSNPFEALGAVASYFCGGVCPTTNAKLRLADYIGCEGFRLFNQLGIVAENFKNIIDEGFKIRTDYCSRLKDIKKELKEKEEVGEVKK